MNEPISLTGVMALYGAVLSSIGLGARFNVVRQPANDEAIVLVRPRAVPMLKVVLTTFPNPHAVCILARETSPVHSDRYWSVHSPRVGHTSRQ
jgi:hypothetical protein